MRGLHAVDVVVVVLDRLLVDVLEHLGGNAHVDLSPVKVLVRRGLPRPQHGAFNRKQA